MLYYTHAVVSQQMLNAPVALTKLLLITKMSFLCYSSTVYFSTVVHDLWSISENILRSCIPLYVPYISTVRKYTANKTSNNGTVGLEEK